jgi:hypothetical protein
MNFEDQKVRCRIVETARSISGIAFAKALLPVSPALLRIHQGGLPHISWAYSLNPTPNLLPTTLDKWAQESHEACVLSTKYTCSWVSGTAGRALNVGRDRVLAVWGIAPDVAQLIIGETAILAGLLTPEQVRAYPGALYDARAGESIRLQFDAVNAS